MTRLTNEPACDGNSVIDERGRPTTYLSFMILKLTFSQPNRWFTPEDLVKLLAAKQSDVDLICRQFKQADLLSEDASQSGRYRYNLNSTNLDIQTRFEKFLVDVELGSVPIHLTLDYSPSFRSRSQWPPNGGARQLCWDVFQIGHHGSSD